jgi:hypothetical protein
VGRDGEILTKYALVCGGVQAGRKETFPDIRKYFRWKNKL